MNTEATQENSNVNSTGERLRSAREQMGLTQKNVAERLCLKLSTIRDLEEDKVPADLAATFLRGYIRSYARLVRVPEEELLPMMAKQAPVRATDVEPMQSISLGKRRKKRDGWLMIFTWLVLFVVIGLTGAWWWQNHKAAQDDLVSMSDQHSSVEGENGQSIPLFDGNADSGIDSSTDTGTESTSVDAQSTSAESAEVNSAPAAASAPAVPVFTPSASAPAVPVFTASAPAVPVFTASAPATPAFVPSATVPVNNTQDSNNQSVVAPGQTSVENSANTQLPVGSADVDQPVVDPNAVLMTFNNDCWLEVTDATGKKLFNGIQHGGGKLSLAGTAPYRLKIGAPAAVQIEYQGKPVDLSHFIRANQVARLTLGAQ